MSWNSLEEALGRLTRSGHPHWNNYLGFYSSWLGGYFKEPWAMNVPMDDHGFHRGDAVFEATRIHARAYIDLQAHLARLERSARAIEMQLPKPLKEIEAICVNLAKLCDSPTGILRLYVTRGPGGFSPSPAEVVGHQVYAAITTMKPPSAELYAQGVRAMFSSIPAKETPWSQIKSCNYLQNVLMKKETVDKGFDFAISVNAEGWVCEGATENLLIVTQDGEVLVPKFDYTLRGTTVSVVMKLAETLPGVKGVRLADLHKDDVRRAREAAFVGTTLGVLPVSTLDGDPIGVGRAGEITQALNRLLMQRMAEDAALRTPF
ncbi:MAG: aminotransferase class IV [Bdellovibrionales bacterium]|nr:aminotransferase class IV [Bdellovibrionales bacterium]